MYHIITTADIVTGNLLMYIRESLKLLNYVFNNKIYRPLKLLPFTIFSAFWNLCLSKSKMRTVIKKCEKIYSSITIYTVLFYNSLSKESIAIISTIIKNRALNLDRCERVARAHFVCIQVLGWQNNRPYPVRKGGPFITIYEIYQKKLKEIILVKICGKGIEVKKYY